MSNTWYDFDSAIITDMLLKMAEVVNKYNLALSINRDFVTIRTNQGFHSISYLCKEKSPEAALDESFKKLVTEMHEHNKKEYGLNTMVFREGLIQ